MNYYFFIKNWSVVFPKLPSPTPAQTPRYMKKRRRLAKNISTSLTSERFSPWLYSGLFHWKTRSDVTSSKLTLEFTWIAVASWSSPGAWAHTGKTQACTHLTWPSRRSNRNSSLWRGYTISSSITLFLSWGSMSSLHYLGAIKNHFKGYLFLVWELPR